MTQRIPMTRYSPMKRRIKTTRRPTRILSTRYFVPLLALAVLSLGCQSTPPPVPLGALRQSGQVSFLCLAADGTSKPLSHCAAGPLSGRGYMTTAAEGHALHALVTQTAGAEVAVVRVTGADSQGYSTAKVLDADPSNPGTTHLRVGRKPRGIATTPGGQASFVGVAEVGRAGIFGLPTSCILAPAEREDGSLETVRDLTTWPACSLPSAPADLRILVDRADASGQLRARCTDPRTSELTTPPAASRQECAVDLSAEAYEPGARKLVVALPDEGRLLVLDAQALLDREPGSFRSCLEADVLEASVPLEVELSGPIRQPLPPELAAEGCTESAVTYGPWPGSFAARPVNMDATNEILLVADEGAPVVHVLDADPCALTERAPLVLTSYAEPNRVVTGKRVAVSPAAPDGQQFAYVVDEQGETRSSIAIFDLTPGRVTGTPLLRPDSSEIPGEPPDRIQFGAPVKDIAFALVDRPVTEPESEVALGRTYCDPDPSVSSDSGGGVYRPSSDYSSGAQPALLRGIFGYALLSTGSVALIDVVDFDAPCRRPSSTNPSAEPDFRGCHSDPVEIPFYTNDRTEVGQPTVTDELSCNVVVPHRGRSDNLVLQSDSRTRTAPPGISAFGRLTRFGRGLPTSRLLAEGRRRPTLLAVDFESPDGSPVPAQLYVGSTLYTHGRGGEPLVIHPALAEQNSLVLPWAQPHAYPTREVVSVSYEGDYSGLRTTGRLASPVDGDEADGDAALGKRLLLDESAAFCQLGAQDAHVTAQIAARDFSLGEGATTRFVRRHSDYVQVTSRLLGENDSHWSDPEGGASCGGGRGFSACDGVFGQLTTGDLPASRDLTILEAYQDQLLVEPRLQAQSGDPDAARVAEELLDLLECCFPGPLSYRLRAGHQWVVRGEQSGYVHPVVVSEATDPDTGETVYPCAVDCRPTASRRRGRAFEISHVDCDETDPEGSDVCGVGPRTDADVVCSYDPGTGPITPGNVGSECIFDSPTRRFAVYRGLSPSERDMSFGFDVLGGFVQKGITLMSSTTSTAMNLPVSLTVASEAGVLGVIDAADRGLVIVDLRTATAGASFF